VSIARLSVVALDCPDPRALATFYMNIVGGDIDEASASDDWVRVKLESGCDLGFQRDPTYQPPDWPHGSPQQAHLDFDVRDLDTSERRVIELGAVKSSTQPEPLEWRVFIDPAGHPFCLCRQER
jgi:predicted enzyme related to lactoylglutathione lyase